MILQKQVGEEEEVLMPNYEYYRTLYTQQRQQVMEQTIQRAYQDLMRQYQEEVRVQENMLEYLQKIRELQMKAQMDREENILRAATGRAGGSGSSAYDLNDALGREFQAVSLLTDTFAKKGKINSDGATLAKSKYKLPSSTIQLLNKLLSDPQALNDKSGWSWLKPKLSTVVDGLEEQQLHQFYVNYGRRIADTTGKTWNKSFKDELSNAINIPYKRNETFVPTQATIEADQSQLQNDHVKNNPIDTSIAESFLQKVQMTPVQAKQQINSKGKTATKKIKELDATTPKVDTTLPPELQGLEFKPIKPPTQEDIYARAAELYEPQSSKRFQRKQQNMRDTFLQDVEGGLQLQAEENIKANIPEYMRPLVGLEVQVSENADKSLQELQDTPGVGYTYGVQLVKEGKKNNKQMIQKIQNDQKLTPEQKEQALIVLGVQQLQRYRSKKKNTEPLK